jgi:hypothetical protein
MISHPLAPNPCWDGYPLAQAEHRRQMRLAAVALDQLLGRRPLRESDGRCHGAEFTASGKVRPCCRQ